MGVASLVLGILALIVAWIPCVGVYALFFSILGLILGAIGMIKAKKTGQNKGVSIAGFVCNVVATAVAIFWCMVIEGAKVAVNEFDKEIEKSTSELSGSLKDLKKNASDLSDAVKKGSGELSGSLKDLKKNATDLSDAFKKW